MATVVIEMAMRRRTSPPFPAGPSPPSSAGRDASRVRCPSWSPCPSVHRVRAEALLLLSFARVTASARKKPPRFPWAAPKHTKRCICSVFANRNRLGRALQIVRKARADSTHLDEGRIAFVALAMRAEALRAHHGRTPAGLRAVAQGAGGPMPHLCVRQHDADRGSRASDGRQDRESKYLKRNSRSSRGINRVLREPGPVRRRVGAPARRGRRAP